MTPCHSNRLANVLLVTSIASFVVVNLSRARSSIAALASVGASSTTGDAKRERRARSWSLACASTVRELRQDERQKVTNKRAGIEIVIAGYEMMSTEDVASAAAWDFASLGDVNLVFYRRSRVDVIPRAWVCDKSCGTITAEERVMARNHGRDGAAFYDYALWRYDDPPLAFAFAHGHQALAWHTSCETMYTRIVRYARDMSTGEAPQCLVTLTFARGRRETKFAPLEWNGGRRLLDFERHPESESCVDTLRGVNITLRRVDVQSCCGSFIAPGKFLRGHARETYEALLTHVMDDTLDDQITSRACFEFIIYALLSPVNFIRDVGAREVSAGTLTTWFERARALRGELKPMMTRCERHYGWPYFGDDHRRVLFNTVWFPARRYVQGD